MPRRTPSVFSRSRSTSAYAGGRSTACSGQTRWRTRGLRSQRRGGHDQERQDPVHPGLRRTPGHGTASRPGSWFGVTRRGEDAGSTATKRNSCSGESSRRASGGGVSGSCYRATSGLASRSRPLLQARPTSSTPPRFPGQIGLHCRLGRRSTTTAREPQFPGRWQPHWRRRRDSNPRVPFGAAGFQNQCIRPLCHTSTSEKTEDSAAFPCCIPVAFWASRSAGRTVSRHHNP